MSKKDTLAILLPYAFKRSLSSYSNEVVLVFKSTSLAYTITLMEVMGYSQLLYGRTYDVMVFGAAGIIYLVVNGLLTLMMRLIERKALAFERRKDVYKRQELFRECSHYCELVSSPEQIPQVLAIAMRKAVLNRGVSVVVLPGDVALKPAPEGATTHWYHAPQPVVTPEEEELRKLAQLLRYSSNIALM